VFHGKISKSVATNAGGVPNENHYVILGGSRRPIKAKQGYLARKFVVYLALAHRESAPALKAAMHTQGGIIMKMWVY
jgi:hypothetical protein